MAIGKPLDLQDIFVNTLAGDMTIFFFMAVILFAYLAARFRMPNQVFLIMIAVFVIFFSSYYPGLFALVVLLIGLFVYYGITRIIKT